MQFKAKLEELFTQETYMAIDIKDKLKISDRAVKSLCKLITSHIGLYKREDIIRTALGGKIYE
ncbi:MAG: phage protein [Anaerocolumna sp.]|nr:phage protein [Anaerocolumna sp.]